MLGWHAAAIHGADVVQLLTYTLQRARNRCCNNRRDGHCSHCYVFWYLSVNSPAPELLLLTLTPTLTLTLTLNLALILILTPTLSFSLTLALTLTLAVNSGAGELTDKNPYFSRLQQ